MILTYRYKIRRGDRNFLRVAAAKVNFVWNYCNQTSFEAIRRDGKFLSGYDLNYLTAHTSNILKLNAHSIKSICGEYATRRRQYKKRKLRWRRSHGPRRSLGWIPFKGNGVRVKDDTVKYMGRKFRFHKSRDLGGVVRTGSFNQDACGDWYVRFTCEVPDLPQAPAGAVGCDLGQKDLVTTSDGVKFENPRLTKRYEEQLAKAQRFGKKKRATRIHRKIARVRHDNLHKISAHLTNTYAKVIVGNLNLKILSSKSMYDSGHGALKTFCAYKAIRRRGEFVLVNEAYTTVTCSNCLARTGPFGVEGLAVREWTCAGCGQAHDRDINAARNILRIGFDTPMTSSGPLAS